MVYPALLSSFHLFICLLMYAPSHPFTHPSIYRPIHPLSHTSNQLSNSSASQTVINLSSLPSNHLSSIQPFFLFSTFPVIHIAIHFFTQPSIHPAIHPSVSLSYISPSIHYPSTHHFSNQTSSLQPITHLFNSLSSYLSIYLSIL